MNTPYLNLHIINFYMNNYDIEKIRLLSKYFNRLINDNWFKISIGIFENAYNYKIFEYKDTISLKLISRCISLPKQKLFILDFLQKQKYKEL